MSWPVEESMSNDAESDGPRRCLGGCRSACRRTRDRPPRPSSRSLPYMGSPMLTPGGVFSSTLRFLSGSVKHRRRSVGSASCARTTLSEGGSRPPESAARASAPSSASVKTGALCFIDFPHESRSSRLVCLESILGLPLKRSGPVSGFPLPVSTRTSFAGMTVWRLRATRRKPLPPGEAI